jgi:nucleoid DNA-binding protein
MTTKELISKISSKCGMTKVRTEELMNATIAAMQKELLDGKSVQLANFGTMEMKRKSAREVVHPSTKQRTLVPEKMQLTFKPSTATKEQLKNA